MIINDSPNIDKSNYDILRNHQDNYYRRDNLINLTPNVLVPITDKNRRNC